MKQIFYRIGRQQFLLWVISSVVIAIIGVTAFAMPALFARAANIPGPGDGSAPATMTILRTNTSNPVEYNNNNEWNVWSYSSCNAAALTAVMRAYGGYSGNIGTVLEYENSNSLWNSGQGLTSGPAGMSQTAAHFGFKTLTPAPHTITQLKWYTDNGMPVIVGFTQAHILVVNGVDTNAGTVSLVDDLPPPGMPNPYNPGVNGNPNTISINDFYNNDWSVTSPAEFSVVIVPNNFQASTPPF